MLRIELIEAIYGRLDSRGQSALAWDLLESLPDGRLLELERQGRDDDDEGEAESDDPMNATCWREFTAPELQLVRDALDIINPDNGAACYLRDKLIARLG